MERNAILQIGIHHPNMPVIVTLDWLIMSIQNNSIQPYHWFQLSEKIQKSEHKIPNNKNSVIGESKKKKLENKALSFNQNPGNDASIANIPKSNALFHDYFFHIVPPSSLTDNDKYSKSTLENHILSNGGTILSNSTTSFLQQKIQQRLRIHVLHLNGDSIVEHKIICDQINQFFPNDFKDVTLIPITPVWIKVCLLISYKEKQKNKKVIQPCCTPTEYPKLFQPQIYKLHPIPHKFKVSISGFTNIERVGVIELLKFMNVPFTDTLQKNNTHLIYPNVLKEGVRKGEKFRSALDWGLFVVCLDWVYFVMENGYFVGCEDKFRYRI